MSSVVVAYYVVGSLLKIFLINSGIVTSPQYFVDEVETAPYQHWRSGPDTPRNPTKSITCSLQFAGRGGAQGQVVQRGLGGQDPIVRDLPGQVSGCPRPPWHSQHHQDQQPRT